MQIWLSCYVKGYKKVICVCIIVIVIQMDSKEIFKDILNKCQAFETNEVFECKNR